MPKIKIPEGIKTSDYIINDEYWDLKTITSNRNDAMANRIKRQEKQATNFIIDISKSKLTFKAAEKQLQEILKWYKWINSIILKKSNEIKIIQKKK